MGRRPKREKYSIKVTPCDGLTLEKRTKEEWSLGYMFKVVWSDSPLWRTGSHITIQDTHDQEKYHPVLFDVEFEFQSVAEYLAEQQEVGNLSTAHEADYEADEFRNNIKIGGLK